MSRENSNWRKNSGRERERERKCVTEKEKKGLIIPFHSLNYCFPVREWGMKCEGNARRKEWKKEIGRKKRRNYKERIEKNDVQKTSKERKRNKCSPFKNLTLEENQIFTILVFQLFLFLHPLFFLPLSLSSLSLFTSLPPNVSLSYSR